MKPLLNLIKNEFGIIIQEYNWDAFNPYTLNKANAVVEDLNIDKIPFEDEEFDKLYKHEDYNYLKEVLDNFKHLKDLKLPRKDYEIL